MALELTLGLTRPLSNSLNKLWFRDGTFNLLVNNMMLISHEEFGTIHIQACAFMSDEPFSYYILCQGQKLSLINFSSLGIIGIVLFGAGCYIHDNHDGS